MFVKFDTDLQRCCQTFHFEHQEAKTSGSTMSSMFIQSAGEACVNI